MEIEQIVMAVLFIVMVFGIGFCVHRAFKKSKTGTESTSIIEKKTTSNKVVSDIEDLDLHQFFVKKKHYHN